MSLLSVAVAAALAADPSQPEPLIALWLHTADNDAGEEVRLRVERFARAMGARFTAEEIAAANAARQFPRTLDPDALGEPR
jgi:molybdopterin-guanine dinucleotide biosynthesis protein A